MSKYRKKPVVIEAYRFDQQHDNYRPDWFTDAVSANKIVTHRDSAYIQTLEGTMRADLGDWIIRGIKGELYPCKHNIFAATYEPEQEGASDTGDGSGASKASEPPPTPR